ncbi:MAG: hypothetical protein ACYCUK_24035 [Thiomonas sp.]
MKLPTDGIVNTFITRKIYIFCHHMAKEKGTAATAAAKYPVDGRTEELVIVRRFEERYLSGYLAAQHDIGETVAGS